GRRGADGGGFVLADGDGRHGRPRSALRADQEDTGVVSLVRVSASGWPGLPLCRQIASAPPCRPEYRPPLRRAMAAERAPSRARVRLTKSETSPPAWMRNMPG